MTDLSSSPTGSDQALSNSQENSPLENSAEDDAILCTARRHLRTLGYAA